MQVVLSTLSPESGKCLVPGRCILEYLLHEQE